MSGSDGTGSAAVEELSQLQSWRKENKDYSRCQDRRNGVKLIWECGRSTEFWFPNGYCTDQGDTGYLSGTWSLLFVYLLEFIFLPPETTLQVEQASVKNFESLLALKNLASNQKWNLDPQPSLRAQHQIKAHMTTQIAKAIPIQALSNLPSWQIVLGFACVRCDGGGICVQAGERSREGRWGCDDKRRI